MAGNKSHITPDNMAEWMASTGIIFPRTLKELMRFEKLHKDVEINLEGSQIDPEIILGRKPSSNIHPITGRNEVKETRLKMAARKGGPNIDRHILDKIKKNQDARKKDDPGS